ncbi:MAG: thioredoxin family protein [Thermodesulfobacteriota bacterium]
MASVLKEVAGETKGRAVIGLVMVSDRELVRTFAVSGIPAIFVVRNAEVTASFVGVVPKSQIEQALRGS